MCPNILVTLIHVFINTKCTRVRVDPGLGQGSGGDY